MNGKPIPEDIRRAILEWDQRRREIGTMKALARRLDLPMGTIATVIRRAQPA